MRWYFRTLQKYAVFKGRSRRKEYWLFVFINTLLISMLLACCSHFEKQLAVDLSFISYSYLLLIGMPILAVSVRRLHDINRSGWWLLLPFISFFFLFYNSDKDYNRFGGNPKHALYF